MEFGPVSVRTAVGAILAHQTRLPDRTLKKGHRITAGDAEALALAGYGDITVARLGSDDAGEDEAAAACAALLRGPHLRVEAATTGRSNIFATRPGLFRADRAAIDAINRVDPGITLATLADYSRVEAGRMVATVKIIPFAVPHAAIGRVGEVVKGMGSPLALHPFAPHRVALVATMLPSLKPSVMDKTRRVLTERLQASGSTLISERRVPHETGAVAAAIAESLEDADLVIVFGASAIADVGDVIPAGLVAAGGKLVHFGMPVDPGNLLLVGRIGKRPVLGAPGCARSPAENGFDWVLDRLLAGIEVNSDDITGLGVGGLLMEIVSRPQPRQPDRPNDKVAAIVLAAGRSSRTGARSKLLAEFDGLPLIRRVVGEVTASGVSETFVVTGHRGEEVAAALAGLDVTRVENPRFAEGLATSLCTGFEAAAANAGAVLVVLADMPEISRGDMARLVAAWRDAPRGAIAIATDRGQRGNPVVIDALYLDRIRRLSGDQGARSLMEENRDAVIEVEIGSPARLDVDTVEAVAAAGGRLTI